MHAHIQCFGVRKRALQNLKAKLRARHPGIAISDTPGCDITPGGVNSVVCVLSDLPGGFAPFKTPEGVEIDPAGVPESLLKTRSSEIVSEVLETLARAVDTTQIHRVTALNACDSRETMSVAWGRGVVLAPRAAA